MITTEQWVKDGGLLGPYLALSPEERERDYAEYEEQLERERKRRLAEAELALTRDAMIDAIEKNWSRSCGRQS